MKTIEFQLSEESWKLAKIVGARRLKSGKGSKGWGDRTVDQESIGVIGEIVACKYFGQRPNWVFGQSDYADLVLLGKKTDVKTSLLKPHWDIDTLHLLAHKVSHHAELYIRVFVSADKKKALMNGWTTREFMEDNAEDYVYEGHHLFRLSNSQLFDIAELKEKQQEYDRTH